MAVDLLAAAAQNLTSVPILFFVLGVAAASLRSDLEIPPAMGKGLSLYLMAAIGFKGGVELARSDWSLQMGAVAGAAVVLSFATPLLAYALLRTTTRLGVVDAAAVAATYGSVSVVTFVTASAFLTRSGIEHAGWLVAVLALMETPAIITGIVLARRAGAVKGPLLPRSVLREALVSGSVLLLLGALAIGWATGERGAAAVGGVLISPFQGILALFLLDMGLLVVRRLRETRALDARLAGFGLAMPVLGAALGLGLAALLGLGAADGFLLAILAGSASYIAVPAALRVAMPEADPGVYVTLSLAVTFPFNIVVGIPLYHAAAGAVLGG